LEAILGDLTPDEGESAGEPSLASGLAGRAILHGYLAQAGRGTAHADVAVRCLRRASTAMTDKPMEASLYGGLTGVGWALAHLQRRVPGLDGEEDCGEIDEVLLHHLEQSPWRDDYDLISGLVGFAVYALERMIPGTDAARLVAVACLERVVDRLAETAQQRGERVTWWTNPAWLPAETREKSPRGYYNLGLAHGVPGVIAVLGLACAAGVARPKARPLLEGAVNWLIVQQKPHGFPHWVQPEVTDGPARLAWCYGDPGVAAALLWTARCVAEPAWEREALAIARRAARRPPDQAGVRDAGLCHGAAGLGHLFNRMFQATGEQQFCQAARYWFEQTLAMRRPGQGIGGYQAWQLGDAGEPIWVTDSGLLTGSTGIALALLAATTPVEPVWDRMLLTAIPPSESGVRGQE
jgi:lantibiotic modifying enzyme